MTRHWAILVVAVCAWQAVAEQITLSTGEVLNAAVIERTESQVTVNHPVLGRLVIVSSQVRDVQPDQAVTSGDGDAAAPDPAAKPKPATEPAAVTATAPIPQPSPTPRDEGPGGLLNTGLFREWATQLSLGLSGAAGNDNRNNITAQFKTKKHTDDRRIEANAAWYYNKAGDDVKQNQFKTKLSHDWLGGDESWFLFASTEYEYNQKRAFENRIGGYGGLGYTFIHEQDFDVNARVGVGGIYEFGDIDSFSPEAVFGGSAANWRITKHQTLSAEATWYPNLEFGGEHRLSAKLDWIINMPDWDKLKLKLGLVTDYESITKGDEEHNDLKYYGALVWSF